MSHNGDGFGFKVEANDGEDSPIYSSPHDDDNYEEDGFDDHVEGSVQEKSEWKTNGDGVENGEAVESGDQDEYSEPVAESEKD